MDVLGTATRRAGLRRAGLGSDARPPPRSVGAEGGPQGRSVFLPQRRKALRRSEQPEQPGLRPPRSPSHRGISIATRVRQPTKLDTAGVRAGRSNVGFVRNGFSSWEKFCFHLISLGINVTPTCPRFDSLPSRPTHRSLSLLVAASPATRKTEWSSVPYKLCPLVPSCND